MAQRYWLMKTEPGAYSIDDLERDGTTSWDGVRNYQARNFMRNSMSVGDLVLFYHSNTKPPGVAGVAKVSKEAHPDHTAFDPDDPHYDPKSKEEDPRWWMVGVAFVEKFAEIVPLDALKADPKLDGMMVTRRGTRLSVQPVDRAHFERVRKMGRR